MRCAGPAALVLALLAAGCGGATHKAASRPVPRAPLCIARVHLCSNDPGVVALERANEQCLNEHEMSAQEVYEFVQVEGGRAAAGAAFRQAKVALEVCASVFITYRRAECIVAGRPATACDQYASDLANLVDDYWSRAEHDPRSSSGPIALGVHLLLPVRNPKRRTPVLPVAAVGVGGAGAISASGVGPLTIGKSTASDVKAFAGVPEYNAPGRNAPSVPHFHAFIALGYGCHHASGGIPTMKVDPATKDAVGSGTDCATVYYLDKTTGRLVGFWTESSGFSTSAGSAVGSAFSTVRTEPGASGVDAPPGFEISSKVGSLFFGSDQSAYRPPPPSARVAYVEIFAAGDPIGLAYF